MRKSPSPGSNDADSISGSGQLLESLQKFQGSIKDDLHIFVLTDPSTGKRQEQFLKKAKALGFVGEYSIKPIQSSTHEYSNHAKKVSPAGSNGQEGAHAIDYPSGFMENATKNLSPEQISSYLTHRKFWTEAAKLPNDAWAIIFEDNADLMAGPPVLRNFLLQAEQAAGKYTGKPAALVYLKQCLAGGNFMRTFMRDSSGYAIRANFAKDLLSYAHGDVPVFTAIKNFAEGGLCAPLIQSDDISSLTSASEPHRPHGTVPDLNISDIPDEPVHIFVLTSPQTTKDMTNFIGDTIKLGYTGHNTIKQINGTDSHQFFPSEDEIIEKLRWNQATRESKKKRSSSEDFS
jgi:hypothetical protein